MTKILAINSISGEVIHSEETEKAVVAMSAERPDYFCMQIQIVDESGDDIPRTLTFFGNNLIIKVIEE